MRNFLSLKKLDRDFSWATSVTTMDEAGWKSLLRPEEFDQSGRPLALAEFEDSRRYWVAPQEIAEFAAVARCVPVDGVKVVRAFLPNGDCGFTYLADLYPSQGCHLIHIDEATMPTTLTLPELFLHELTHTKALDDLHDWHFLLALTALRSECGLGPTTDPYDYHSERPEEWAVPMEKLPGLAISEVQRLRQQFSLEVVLDLIRGRQVGHAKERLKLPEW
jgi:hypothetical protein